MARKRSFRFTDGQIANLPTPRKREEHGDLGCPGLRLRCGPSGVRSFLHYYGQGKGRVVVILGRWASPAAGDAIDVATARQKFLAGRPQLANGNERPTTTVGELLDEYRSEVSSYTFSILEHHLRESIGQLPLGAVETDRLARLVRALRGRPAIADKVRAGLVRMFGWARRQGMLPKGHGSPAADLVKSDFSGIGWRDRDRVLAAQEIQMLFDSLGISTGEVLRIDDQVNPRVSVVARLALYTLLHVPVRSAVGLLRAKAGEIDLDAGTLTIPPERNRKPTSRRGAKPEGTPKAQVVPLSAPAIVALRQLRDLPGGGTWACPSPEEPNEPVDEKFLARALRRLQTPGRETPARLPLAPPIRPHDLRRTWRSLAGELGIDDLVAEKVMGHTPAGASAVQAVYDRSERRDAQREAVERVSAALEDIRQRKAATVVALGAARRG